jgi:hypothetical protein
MNATLLAMVLWGAAALGVIAAIAAIALPRLRRVLFVVAAVLFLPIGVLGIMSIGAVFLVAAGACVVAAVLWRGGRRPRTPTPSST